MCRQLGLYLVYFRLCHASSVRSFVGSPSVISPPPSSSPSSRRTSSRLVAPSFHPRLPRPIRSAFDPLAKTLPCLAATSRRSRLAPLSLKARRRWMPERTTFAACPRLWSFHSSFRPLLRLLRGGLLR